MMIAAQPLVGDMMTTGQSSCLHRVNCFGFVREYLEKDHGDSDAPKDIS
jgi:hypothetical protein